MVAPMRLCGAPVGAIVPFVGMCVVGCAYQPDSFTSAREPFRGWYVTADCLDLAIQRLRHRTTGNQVVTYEFGNRCDEPALVDLASATVLGHTADGVTFELAPFDPFGEIRAMTLDARAYGRETFEYPARDAVGLCVDAASIARASPPQWLCFRDRR